jgi:hypothetical protein
VNEGHHFHAALAKLMAEDVFAYKAEMKARQAKALPDLDDVDGELI